MVRLAHAPKHFETVAAFKALVFVNGHFYFYSTPTPNVIMRLYESLKFNSGLMQGRFLKVSTNTFTLFAVSTVPVLIVITEAGG
jgi:hypothetical protein